MKTANNCRRVVLAGGDGCRVLYCEECNVAEVEVGALSLRLEEHAFNSLAEMIQEAAARLAIYSANKSHSQFTTSIKNVH
ncbi:hypothetical protein LG198_13240 [Methylobacillus arboreus]|uniref:hypothetical protein n=1 Tax=Methylobacillus arboreus TaxID=755170 RepID=UPI001E6300E0|nr:hypothetical protein [Methylobacillus arboreus]MCB5191697.1 hypothetical protein [Methylobacillus arboreus]